MMRTSLLWIIYLLYPVQCTSTSIRLHNRTGTILRYSSEIHTRTERTLAADAAIGELTRANKKRRILHDIGVVAGNYRSIIEVFNRIKSELRQRAVTSFVLLQIHRKRNFEHLHVIHDCSCNWLLWIPINSQVCLWLSRQTAFTNYSCRRSYKRGGGSTF